MGGRICTLSPSLRRLVPLCRVYLVDARVDHGGPAFRSDAGKGGPAPPLSTTLLIVRPRYRANHLRKRRRFLYVFQRPSSTVYRA